MPHCDYDPTAGDVIVVTDWNEKELVKLIPGASWDVERKLWRLPASWASLVQLRGVFRDRLTVGEGLNDWAWDLRRRRVDPALELRDATEPRFTDGTLEAGILGRLSDPRLRGFQRAGVEFMWTAEAGLLGDEMGAGKTAQLVSLIGAGGALPALVVCPNSVKFHWRNEVAKWFPDLSRHVYVVDGSAAARRKVLAAARHDPRAIVVINIESVRLFSRLAPYGSIKLRRCRECDPRHGDEGLARSRCDVHAKELNAFEFRSVTIDEAHRIKDPRAQQTRALWHLMHQPSVACRWALTGTPVANDPSDLWPIMHAVAPDDFPRKSAFVDRYCLTSWNAFGALTVIGIKPEMRAEFFQLLNPRFRRMLKALVLPQLPPKIRQVRRVELPAKARKLYRELEATLQVRLADGELFVAPNQLVKATRLMQFAAATVEVDKPNPDDPTTWIVDLVEPSWKIDELESIVTEIGITDPAYDGAPVLIAGEHIALLRLAAERLRRLGVPHRFMHGGTPAAERDLALRELHAGQLRALVFSSGTGGVGLDMSPAATLINLQRSWSLVVERQKEDRNHRPGAERHTNVLIIDIVCDDTIEEDQIERLHEKLNRLDEITQDRARLRVAGVTQTPDLDAEEQQLVAAFVGAHSRE